MEDRLRGLDRKGKLPVTAQKAIPSVPFDIHAQKIESHAETEEPADVTLSKARFVCSSRPSNLNRGERVRYGNVSLLIKLLDSKKSTCALRYSGEIMRANKEALDRNVKGSSHPQACYRDSFLDRRSSY